MPAKKRRSGGQLNVYLKSLTGNRRQWLGLASSTGSDGGTYRIIYHCQEAIARAEVLANN
jgi:hypothetical protein